MSAGIKSLLKNLLGQIAILFVAISTFYAFTPPVETIKDVEIANGFAYLALGKQGIRVMDITDPSKPFEVAKFNTHGVTYDLAIEDSYLIAADGKNGVLVFDIKVPAEISFLWEFTAPKDARAVSLRGDYAYLADNDHGLYIQYRRIPSQHRRKVCLAHTGGGIKTSRH